MQVATIDIECQYYKFVAFDKSTHKLIIIMTELESIGRVCLAKCTVSTWHIPLSSY